MNSVELLEKIYRLSWESLKEKEIKLMMNIKMFPFFYGSIFGGLFTFLAISGINVNSGNLTLDYSNVTLEKIIVCISIGVTTFIAPFLFLYLHLISNKAYKNVDKFDVLKTMWYLKFTNIELDRSDKINEVCEYLNILVQTASPLESDVSLANYRLQALVAELTPAIKYQNQAYGLRDTFHTRYDFHNRSRHNYSSTKVIEQIIIDYQDKEVFFKKYLREEKTFKSFFYEKISDDNKQDIGFLFFSLLIPRRKEMNLDIYKTILGTCCLELDSIRLNLQVEINDKMKSKYGSYCQMFENMNKIEKAFSQYSDLDLKRIFTNNYTKDSFYKTMLEITISNKENILPVFKRWSDIQHFIENCMQVYKTPDFNTKLENIEDSIYSFKSVLTYSHLGTLANILQNCLKSRHDRLKVGFSQILEIRKNNQTYGALEISKNVVVEIKGVKNEHLSDSKEIIDLLVKNKIVGIK